jgi:hypothetical protein
MDMNLPWPNIGTSIPGKVTSPNYFNDQSGHAKGTKILGGNFAGKFAPQRIAVFGAARLEIAICADL